MKIEEVAISRLPEIGRIPITFTVSKILEILPEQAGGFLTREYPVEHPYQKDYDACVENHPADWSKQFDTSHWGLLFANEGDLTVGSALIAWRTPGVEMLEDRSDLAVLWDLRVRPGYRGRGIGTALFQEVKCWSREHGCSTLKIETQTNNAEAVRFYQKQGCAIKQISPHAYQELPEEVQVLLYLYLECYPHQGGNSRI